MDKKLLGLVIGTTLLLGACTGGQARYPTGFDRTETRGDIYAKRDTVFGDKGVCIGGGNNQSNAPAVYKKAKISLTEAIRLAENETKGKALSAEIGSQTILPRYGVKILKQDKILDVTIDARSGAILGVSGNR